MNWYARLTPFSALLAAAITLLAGCATPPPAGGVRFALIGDVPYSEGEAAALEAVIDEMNASPLAFIAHVGDITSGNGPCTDEWFEARKRQFARWRAPLVLLPGDNDWTDCHRTGFDPIERLSKWRVLFCTDPPGLRIERQSGAYGEYCEHVRWEMDGVLFVAINVPGSNNNLGRTAAMDAEYAARMKAVFAWLDESATRASKGLVILMQANPDFELALWRRPGAADGFATLREWLARARKPIVLVHGDTHWWQDDEPLPGLRRIEVPGSPQVRWVRGVLKDGKFWFD